MSEGHQSNNGEEREGVGPNGRPQRTLDEIFVEHNARFSPEMGIEAAINLFHSANAATRTHMRESDDSGRRDALREASESLDRTLREVRTPREESSSNQIEIQNSEERANTQGKSTQMILPLRTKAEVAGCSTPLQTINTTYLQLTFPRFHKQERPRGWVQSNRGLQWLCSHSRCRSCEAVWSPRSPYTSFLCDPKTTRSMGTRLGLSTLHTRSRRGPYSRETDIWAVIRVRTDAKSEVSRSAICHSPQPGWRCR